MRFVKLAKAPPDLAGATSLGGREIKAAIEFYKIKENREAAYPFKAYKAKRVIEVLQSEFKGKCAYCESRYAHLQPMDVEHYRPKGGYVVVGEPKPTLAKPGYYWLAAVWTNLLPSCIDCNRARQHEVDGVVETVGKANQFPLADEATRATGPGQERRERRLLLHPARDRPEQHLRFGDDGTVDPAPKRGGLSPQGEASIRVYALDRKELVDARREKLTRMQVLMTNIEELAGMREAGTKGLDGVLGSLRAELETHAAPESEYTLMARQAIDRFEERLIG